VLWSLGFFNFAVKLEQAEQAKKLSSLAFHQKSEATLIGLDCAVFKVPMIPLLNVNWQGIPPDYALRDRDADVLSLIDEENLTTFTFDGLKRRLGLHPETLSRILSRLEEEGIVKKTPEGYKVTPKLTRLKLHALRHETQSVSLLQTYLPSNILTQQLISTLKGKWFGILRWLGISETSEGVTLKWVTEDGGIQIAANISGNALNIDAKFLRDNNLDLALKAAYQLMAHIGKLYSGTKLARHVAYYGGDLDLMSA
jgi:DNA-binding Lrp family transcriptional regulator